MRLAILLAIVLCGCGSPQDPRGTTDRVRGGTLVVAVLHHPPWAAIDGDQVSGSEVELVATFARQLDADVVWVPSDHASAFGALEHGQVDLVIGGLDAKDPWKRKVGMTRPYHTERICLGEAPGATSADPVFVAVDEPAADALPDAERVLELPATARRALAPTWQLDAMGMTSTGWCPAKREHVLAVAPGENGFLMTLERFLGERRR